MENNNGRKSLEELNELFRRQFQPDAAAGETSADAGAAGSKTNATGAKDASGPAAAAGPGTETEPPAAAKSGTGSAATKKGGRKTAAIVVVLLLLAAAAALGIFYFMRNSAAQRSTGEVSIVSASSESGSSSESVSAESESVEEEATPTEAPTPEGSQEADGDPDGTAASVTFEEETESPSSGTPAENAYMTKEEQLEWQTMEADASAVPIELNTHVSVYGGTRAFLHLVNPVYSLYTEQIRIYAAGNVDDVYYQSEKLSPGSVLEAVILEKAVEESGSYVVEYTVINAKGNTVGTYPIDIEMHPAEDNFAADAE